MDGCLIFIYSLSLTRKLSTCRKTSASQSYSSPRHRRMLLLRGAFIGSRYTGLGSCRYIKQCDGCDQKLVSTNDRSDLSLPSVKYQDWGREALKCYCLKKRGEMMQWKWGTWTLLVNFWQLSIKIIEEAHVRAEVLSIVPVYETRITVFLHASGLANERKTNLEVQRVQQDLLLSNRQFV